MAYDLHAAGEWKEFGSLRRKGPSGAGPVFRPARGRGGAGPGGEGGDRG